MHMRGLLLILALAVPACSNEDATSLPPGSGGSEVVRFIVLGDTGAPAPEGESGNVAAAVEKVCALRGCDFAIAAGDNFYEQGVASEADPLFEIAFRQPFANVDMPFFMALGNHDNSYLLTGEGGINRKGDFQVDYHYSPLNADGKWNMPDRYYSAVWPPAATNPVLELVVLDSSPIAHVYDDDDPAWSGANLETYIAAQQVFVADALAGSRARWKFALAHHPYISNGDHGNAGQYDVGAATDPCAIAGPLASDTCRGEPYKAFIEQTVCNRADVFFNGHDHNLYWLNPVAACGKTEHILSGAGSKERSTLDPERNAARFQVGEIFGFFWVELRGDTFTGAAYTIEAGGAPTSVDSAGNPLPAFESSFQRRP